MISLQLPCLGIALLLASGCAKTGRNSDMAAGFTDTLTIAYIPRGMQTFSGFDHYRESGDVAQELGYIDYAVRHHDLGTVELDRSEFGKLQALAVAPSIDVAELSKLSLTTKKLLLVLGGDYGNYKTSGTKVMDAMANTLSVAGFLAGERKPDAIGPSMRETNLRRHAFRAILFNARAGRLFDTTLVATTESMRGRQGLEPDGTLGANHYILYIKEMKARRPPGLGLP